VGAHYQETARWFPSLGEGSGNETKIFLMMKWHSQMDHSRQIHAKDLVLLH
jgi:hypothetical protein